MTQATATETIERTVHVDARPETVFAFFTEEEKLLRWFARRATVEARPGGLLRLDRNGVNIMRGEFVEVVPHRRVVFTWGWEQEDSPAPGQSTVEVTFEPEGNGTRLRLVHRGLTADQAERHTEGWDHFLPRVAEMASGRDAGPDAWAPSQPELLAAELRDVVEEATSLVQGIDEARWKKAVPGEERPVGVLAHHIAMHLGLAQVAGAVAAGQRPPQADLTAEMVSELNAKHAKELSGVSRETVLAALAEGGPRATATIRGLTTEALAKSQPVAAAGGQPMSVEQIVRGPILDHMRSHLANIRSVLWAVG